MHANRYRRAFPRAAFRHVHLVAKPFVVVGYHLPGDPSAPIGLMYGTHPERPRFTVIAEPESWASKMGLYC